MRRHRPSAVRLQLLCEDFNRRFPKGTPVILRTDRGDVETVVDTAAWVLQGHSAVALFRDISGAYSIENDRVRALPVKAGAP